jgi:hypothetical protein
MEVAGAISYFNMQSISWFFAACSLIGFEWYVLLFMQKGKKRQTTRMTRMDNMQLLKALKEMTASLEAIQAKTKLNEKSGWLSREE